MTVDAAVYGHVHKQLLQWQSRATNHQSRSIGMPYFNWEALKITRAQYADRSERWGIGKYFIPKSLMIIARAEYSALSKGLPFIEMYEELRR